MEFYEKVSCSLEQAGGRERDLVRRRRFLGLSEGMKEHGSCKDSQKGSHSVREVRFLSPFPFSVSPTPFSSLGILSL